MAAENGGVPEAEVVQNQQFISAYMTLQNFPGVEVLQFVYIMWHIVDNNVWSLEFGAVLWSSASPNTSLTLYTFWLICNSGVLLVLLAVSALRSLLSCVEVCASCRMSDNCLAKISVLCVGRLCAGSSFAKDVSTGNRMFHAV